MYEKLKSYESKEFSETKFTVYEKEKWKRERIQFSNHFIYLKAN